MEKLKINIELGMTIYLERMFNNRKIKSAGKIVGSSPPDYFIVEIPYTFGNPLFTDDKAVCISKILNKGTLLGFRSRISKVLTEPYPLFFLEFPKDVEELSLRKKTRIDSNLGAEFGITAAPPSKEFKDKAEKNEDSDERPAKPKLLKAAGPILATIVDLAANGCQLAIKMLDPECVNEKQGAMLRKEIPVKMRRMYYVNSLNDICAAGRKGKLTFNLPAPINKQVIELPFEIRWNKNKEENYYIGLSFIDLDPDIKKSITDVIEYQQLYFQNDFDPI